VRQSLFNVIVPPRDGRGSRWTYRGARYYRRQAKARQEAALVVTFARAGRYVGALQADLAEAARCQAVAAAIIGEMAAF
jgi:hypothetical protein